ncbi:MAG TPA: dTDP-4-dehydrorhamnose reductase [Gemmatimonadaceae bacterium]|nr:dTDP-4-dehydrorhamnose reductase [Gemmatimonadaceae bacterium]
MTRTVMITGAMGQLGYELQRTAPEGIRVVLVGRATLDLGDGDAVNALVEKERPDAIINAAAYTAVDRAESEPEVAEQVNVGAVARLANAARLHGVRLVHVSTDFVFGDGHATPRRVDDATAPLSVYGRTKRDGEAALLSTLGARALVIRTAWLYSAHGTNFVKTMLRLMREREAIRVVADQVGSPTWANSLARTLWAAVDAPEVSGVLHWTDAGVASWYDFAVAVHEEARERGLLVRDVAVTPIPTSEYPTPAQRPVYSVLDTTETTRRLGITPSHWRVNLRHMLNELDHG